MRRQFIPSFDPPRWAFAALAFLLLPACVSTKSYHRDVDTARAAGRDEGRRATEAECRKEAQPWIDRVKEYAQRLALCGHLNADGSLKSLDEIRAAAKAQK